VHVFRPLALPPREHPRARALSAPFVRAQVRRAVAGASIERPVVVATRWVADLAGAVEERLRVFVVKDLAEADGSLLGRSGETLAAEVEEMCELADLVCATSTRLTQALRERGVAAELLPHGFHAELAPGYHSPPVPSEYAGLPRPLLGYAGRIDERLDFSLIEAVADRFRSGSVLLIGPTSPRLDEVRLERLRRRANVSLLGPRQREELPAYIAHLDCCLMPYRDSEWLRHASPLKLWDYLYAGPPIVGAGCAALTDYPPPLVNFAAGAEAFCAAIAESLANAELGRAERREFALANSWEARAETLESLVRDAEASPTSRRSATSAA
jgi:teichuronic acid biosynthesis glycosyltransferase TuaH